VPDLSKLTDSDVKEDFDIHNPTFVVEPYPTYDHLRDEYPVLHSNLYGGIWLLTRYDDVRQAAIDWQTYTSTVPGVTAIPIITQRTEPMLPIELDPPIHSRYRALMSSVFSKTRIDEMRPKVENIAIGLIEKLIEQGGGDLVADYAEPLSVETLAEFSNLPKSDSGTWIAWIKRMFDVTDPEDSKRASLEFGQYIDQMIASRSKEPQGDFISMLMESEVDGHRLTNQEIHSFCTVLFGAGFETTADAISVTLYYLAKHREAWQHLVSQPELIPTAVEEFLRYVSPIQIFGRNAAKHINLHQQTIYEGDIVALSFGSANHDPTIFPNPDQCILARSPNRHLAFGAGVHKCLGAPVARLEMEITLQEFTRRVSHIHVTPNESIEWKKRGDRRGLARLPVVLAS